METKLKKLLRKRNISQKKLYDKISKIYETPIGQYALSEIVNGKKLNYHIITLVKICNVLKVKPQSIVESDSLDMELLKPEYIKYLKKNKETLDSATIPSNKEQMKDNMEIVINNVLFKEDESSLEVQAKHTNWEDEDVDYQRKVNKEALKHNKEQ